MKARRVYYDYLRILAMLLVIGVHAVGSIVNYATTDIEKTAVSILGALNSFGVPIFFAISGFFVLRMECDNLWAFYKKRFVRIVIPYLIYALFYVCYFTGVEGKNYIGIPLAYVVSILTGRVHPTHWFVYTILVLYFFAPFISRMLHSLNRTELAILTFGAFFIHFITQIVAFYGIENGFDDGLIIPSALLIFVAGYAMNRLANEYALLNRLKKYRFVAALALAIVYYFWRIETLQYLAITILVIEPVRDAKSCRVITNVARYSYSIYLIHAAVISLVLKLYSGWESLLLLKVALLYIVILLIGYILVRIIDYVITDRIIGKIRINS